MSWRAALLAVAALVLQAPPALAGTVSVTGGVLTFQAAPGEVNDAAVQFVPDDNEYLVRDSAPVSTGPGCASKDFGIRCPAAGVTTVELDLGDGDDRGDAG